MRAVRARRPALRRGPWRSVIVLALGLAMLSAPLAALSGGYALADSQLRHGPSASADGPPNSDGGRFGAGSSDPAGSSALDRPGVRAWLAQGTVPGAGTTYASLVRSALADLHGLTQNNGAVIAAYTASWHYVWPRDASFAAVAYAETGHLGDARQVLTFLQGVQAADGSFQARYLPDGSGPPDARGIQDDGPGWVLWATENLLEATPAVDRPALLTELSPMIDRSLSRLLRLTDNPAGLPPPSMDYWEQPEVRLTLGTAAPTLAGLQAGAALVSATDPALAARADSAAARLELAIVNRWEVADYDRYGVGGSTSAVIDSTDAAVTFAMPPYVDAALPGTEPAAAMAQRALRQPAGGLSPGGGWPHTDGISWTPETALFMLADAANGHGSQARSWLSWISAHRSLTGAIPEKVLPDGSAGGVAPLGWTDALVILTVHQLGQDSATVHR